MDIVLLNGPNSIAWHGLLWCRPKVTLKICIISLKHGCSLHGSIFLNFFTPLFALFIWFLNMSTERATEYWPRLWHHMPFGLLSFCCGYFCWALFSWIYWFILTRVFMWKFQQHKFSTFMHYFRLFYEPLMDDFITCPLLFSSFVTWILFGGSIYGALVM